jgi:hypothetical protein
LDETPAPRRAYGEEFQRFVAPHAGVADLIQHNPRIGQKEPIEPPGYPQKKNLAKLMINWYFTSP